MPLLVIHRDRCGLCRCHCSHYNFPPLRAVAKTTSNSFTAVLCARSASYVWVRHDVRHRTRQVAVGVVSCRVVSADPYQNIQAIDIHVHVRCAGSTSHAFTLGRRSIAVRIHDRTVLVRYLCARYIVACRLLGVLSLTCVIRCSSKYLSYYRHVSECVSLAAFAAC